MKFLKRSRLSFVLLGLCFIHIFIIGLIPDIHTKDLYFSISITAIFIFAYLSVIDSDKTKLSLPVIAIVILWLAELMDFPILLKFASFTTFVFFFFIIFRLMRKVVESNEVSILDFADSINAYLLFGIAGSLIFNAIYIDSPDAFNVPELAQHGISAFIYYTFVTLSTTGYGDITPLTPVARNFSIFFSVAGQLYMAMIVAVLVGKYLSHKTK